MYGNSQHGHLAPPRLDGTANTDYDAPDTRAELRTGELPGWLQIIAAVFVVAAVAVLCVAVGVAWMAKA